MARLGEPERRATEDGVREVGEAPSWGSCRPELGCHRKCDRESSGHLSNGVTLVHVHVPYHAGCCGEGGLGQGARLAAGRLEEQQPTPAPAHFCAAWHLSQSLPQDSPQERWGSPAPVFPQDPIIIFFYKDKFGACRWPFNNI